MTEFNTNALERVTIEALERTAFVLVDPCDPEDTAPPTHFAQIRFTGPRDGSITVSASEGFLRELASSLLGIESDEIEIETEGLDAIRELANILGGSVLNDIGGQDSEFSLGLPELVDGDSGEPGLVCCFDCEGESLSVTCRGVGSESQAKAA